MFAYCPSETIIPSLTFTKAELIYAITVLMPEISPTDNSTRIEMVELRHYLNLIKDKVDLALADGTIGRLLANTSEKSDKDTVPKPQEPTMPSMAELRRQFPSLSEDEIKEVIENAKSERKKLEEEERMSKPPSPPSFIAKDHIVTEDEMLSSTVPTLTDKQEQDRENSRKFASMLGSL